MSLSCAPWAPAIFEHPWSLRAGVHSPKLYWGWNNLLCCQLNLPPTTFICQCPIPLPEGLCCWCPLSMPFMILQTSVKPPPPFSCLFFRLFYSFSHSSYSISFILLIILVTLFWNFFSLSTPFWERKTITASRIEGMNKSWTYIVVWWWRPVFSFFLSWQLLMLALSQTAYW